MPARTPQSRRRSARFVPAMLVLAGLARAAAATPALPEPTRATSATPAFRQRFDFASATHAFGIATGDLDGDGRPDVVVGGTADTVAVFITGADGSPGVPRILSVDGSPGVLEIADLDGDGRADLCVADSWQPRFYLLRGHGDGTFDPPVTIATGFSAATVLAISDLDGDGVRDLVWAPFYGTVFVARGRGVLAYDSPAQYRLPDGVGAIRIADVDGDRAPDIVCAQSQSGAAILWGAGDGTFAAAVTVAAGGGLGDVGVADVNGDGRPDVVGTGYDTQRLVTLPATGARTFGAPITRGFRHSGAFRIVDLNADGVPDVVASGYYEAQLGIATGLGDGSFADPSAVPVAAPAHAIAIADFDRDGRPDVACVGYTLGLGSILLGAPDGGRPAIGSRTMFRTGAGPIGVGLADLDADGHVDLVATHYGGASFSVRPGGGRSFGPRTDYPAAPEAALVALGDVDHDGHVDVTFGNHSGASASVARGLGDGTLAPVDPWPANYGTRATAIGDFDGNGVPDLIAVNESFGTMSAWRNGDPSYSNHSESYCGPHPLDVVLSDLDGAGRDAALVVADWRLDVKRFGGLFGWESRSIDLGAPAMAVAAGDLDRDGHRDAVVALDDGTVLVLHGDARGVLTPWSRFTAGPAPRGLALADFDGDGVLDVAVGTAGDDALHVRAGYVTGFFGPETRVATGRSPQQLAAGDVNGDGRPDVVAACAGSNAVALHLAGGGTIANRPPAVADDAVEFRADHAITIAVLDNDEDADGDSLRLLSVTPGHAGDVAIDAAAQHLEYRPLTDGWALDSLVYVVGDGRGGSASATVRLRLRGVDSPPVALPDTAYVPPFIGVAQVRALDNDRDPDGDALRIVDVGAPASGSASIADSGRAITYFSRYSSSERDSFDYTISDGWGGAAVGRVLLLPKPPNVPPRFESPWVNERRPDPVRLTASAGVPLHLEFRVDDSDSPGDITLDATDLPAGASMTPALPAHGRSLRCAFDWTPGAAQLGTAAVRFYAFDSEYGVSTLDLYVDVGTSGFSVDQRDAGTPAALDVVAAGPQGGVFVAGDGVARRTRDGVRWDAVAAPGGRRVRAAAFDGARLLVAGDGLLAASDDLGDTWRTWPADSAARWNALAVVATGRAIAVGDRGAIARLDAGGWTAMASGTTHELRGCAVSGEAAWAVGDGGTVLRLDGGAWQSLPVAPVADLRDAAFLDARHGFVAGAGGVWATDDGGATWRRSTSDSIGDAAAIEATCSGAVWAVGQDAVVVSSDGGATWGYDRPGTHAALNALAIGGAGRWAVGASGACLSLAGPGGLVAPACGLAGPAGGCAGATLVYHAGVGAASIAWSVAGAGAIVGPADRESVVVAAGPAPGALTVRLRRGLDGCASACSLAVAVGGCAVRACPRSAEWWSRTCGAAKPHDTAAAGFAPADLQRIAVWVAARAQAFDWDAARARDALCAALAHAAGERARARRLFAALLANVAAAELGLVTTDGAAVGLSGAATVACAGRDVGVDAWLDELDRALVQPVGRGEGRGADRRAIACIARVLRGDPGARSCGVDPFAAAEPENAALDVLDADAASAAPSLAVRVLPNPMHQAARVTFGVAAPGTRVRVGVYDAAGRRVRELADDVRDAGAYALPWDGRDAAGGRVRPGLYFVRWSVGARAGVERVLYLY